MSVRLNEYNFCGGFARDNTRVRFDARPVVCNKMISLINLCGFDRENIVLIKVHESAADFFAVDKTKQ